MDGSWLKNMPATSPRTEEEREIARVMDNAAKLDRSLAAQGVPRSAISVGLINMGVRIGGETTDTRTLADYLRGVANIIEAHEGGDAHHA